MSSSKSYSLIPLSLQFGLLLLLLSHTALFASNKESEQKPQIVVQSGHSAMISAIAFSPDGDLIASAGDSTIVLWDRKQKVELFRLSGHKANVNAVAFSPNGQWLVSVSDDHTGIIWNVESHEKKFLLNQHADAVLSVAINAEGSQLATGASDNSVILWNPIDGKCIREFPSMGLEIESLAYSPDGNYLAIGPVAGPISIVDLKSGHIFRENGDFQERRLLNLLFSPGGDTLIGSGGAMFGKRGAGFLATWSVPNLSIVIPAFEAHSESATGLAFDSISHQVISGGYDGFVKTWDWPRLSPRHQYQVSFAGSKNRLGNSVTTLKTSPNGKELLAGTHDAGFQGWRLPDFAPIVWPPAFTSPVQAVRIDSQGKFILSSLRTGSLSVWQATSARPLHSFQDHTGLVMATAMSPDGSTFASGGIDGRIVLRKTNRVSAPYTPKSHLDTPISVLTFGETNDVLYVGDSQGRFWRWDVVGNVKTVLGKGRSEISGLVFTKTERGTMVGGASLSGDIYIWHGGRPNPVRTDSVNAIDFLTFNSNRNSIVSGETPFNPPHSVAQPSTITFRRLIDGKDLDTMVVDQGELSSIAFSKSASMFATGGASGVIKLWDEASHSELFELPGHTSQVWSLSFSSDNSRLYSAADDGLIKVWDLRSKAQLASLISARTGDAYLIATPDGWFDGTADAMRNVYWREPNTNKIVSMEAFYNDFYRPGLLSEIMNEEDIPQPPAELAAILRLPAWQTMVQQNLAHFEPRGRDTLLCLSREASPDAGRGLKVTKGGSEVELADEFTPDPNSSTCALYKIIPYGLRDLELVGIKGDWKPKPYADPTGTAKVDKATLHVFTVAVKNYEPTVMYAASGIYSKLSFSTADADAVMSLFRKMRTNKTSPFANIRFWPQTPLRDKTATLENIRRTLAEMASSVRRDDVVLLFFSGHGRVPPGQEMFYFMPYVPPQGEYSSVLEERDTGLSTAMLAEAIRDMPARRVILVIDACQSGGAVESLGKIAEVKDAAERSKDKLLRSTPSVQNTGSGVYVLAAATPLQAAAEPDARNVVGKRKHGYLTEALLEALGDKSIAAGDGTLWINKVVRSASVRVRVLSGNAQTALPVGIGTDFPIAKVYNARGADIASSQQNRRSQSSLVGRWQVVPLKGSKEVPRAPYFP